MGVAMVGRETAVILVLYYQVTTPVCFMHQFGVKTQEVDCPFASALKPCMLTLSAIFHCLSGPIYIRASLAIITDMLIVIHARNIGLWIWPVMLRCIDRTRSPAGMVYRCPCQHHSHTHHPDTTASTWINWMKVRDKWAIVHARAVVSVTCSWFHIRSHATCLPPIQQRWVPLPLIYPVIQKATNLRLNALLDESDELSRAPWTHILTHSVKWLSGWGRALLCVPAVLSPVISLSAFWRLRATPSLAFHNICTIVLLMGETDGLVCAIWDKASKIIMLSPSRTLSCSPSAKSLKIES